MLAGDPDMQGMPVGLVDDLPSKQGQLIHGVNLITLSGLKPGRD